MVLNFILKIIYIYTFFSFIYYKKIFKKYENQTVEINMLFK